MIDGSEKRNRQLAFELQNSHACKKRSKVPNMAIICKSLLSSKSRLAQLHKFLLQKRALERCSACYKIEFAINCACHWRHTFSTLRRLQKYLEETTNIFHEGLEKIKENDKNTKIENLQYGQEKYDGNGKNLAYVYSWGKNLKKIIISSNFKRFALNGYLDKFPA